MLNVVVVTLALALCWVTGDVLVSAGQSQLAGRNTRVWGAQLECEGKWCALEGLEEAPALRDLLAGLPR